MSQKGVYKAPAKTSPFKHNLVGSATFVIGAEGSNIINVGIQLLDENFNELVERGSVRFYLSADSHGDAIAGTAMDTIAIGTDGLYQQLTAGKAGFLTSEADGDIDLNLTYASGALTVYLVLVMPDGSLVVSDAITFA